MGYTFTNVSVSTAAVTNRFLASQNMKVGSYTPIANASPAWQGACNVTITHTTVAGTDTLGTVTVAGTDLTGRAISETLTPVADSTVTGALAFRTVTAITGAGWVLNTTADTIVVGCAAGAIVCGSQGNLSHVVVNTTQAAAVTVADAGRTIATLKASIAEGSYSFGGIDFAGYLRVSTTSTNDLTIVHTATLPSSYSL